MPQYLCPFSLFSIRQIPSKLVSEYNLGLEAIIFDGEQIKDVGVLKKQILGIQKQFPGKLKSVHFPTESANYLENEDMYKALIGLIDVCIECSISKIVIHSNYCQSFEVFDSAALIPVRAKFEEVFTKINTYIGDRKCLLLVENTPVIGNLGDDFDSIFVFPNDFLGLRKLTNIGIAWDFGHWAFTTMALNSQKNIPSTRTQVDFWEFKEILIDIKHIHLSSFMGIPDHLSSVICIEGIPMHRGDFSKNFFKEALQLLITTKSDILISLEIVELDYAHRRNLAETLAWLRTNYLI